MVVGESVPVLDAAARVTGQIEYLVNMRLPQMLYGKIVRSTVAHGEIVRVDTTQAQKVPGVIAAITGSNLEPRKPYGMALKDRYAVAVDRVRFVGEPVAAIAAESLEAAEQAAALVEVEYKPLPAVYEISQAIAPGAPVVYDEHPDNLYAHAKLRHGDIDAGFAAADEVFEDTFRSPAAQHVSLEPHGAIAQWKDGQLTVWTGTQAPSGVARVLAELFGTGPEGVRVIVPQLGGGYGGKGGIHLEPVAAYLAAKTNGRPVKIVLSREEEFVEVLKHAALVHIKTGVKRDGTFTARQVQVYWAGGAYVDQSMILVRAGMVRAVGPYRIPNVWVDSYGVYANLPPSGSFRGAMTSQVVWAYESQMDMIARRMGWDPYEFRIKNLLRDGDEFATGETMHGTHFVECLEAVRDPHPQHDSDPHLTSPSKGEGQGSPHPASPPERGGRKVGRGYAVMMKSTIPVSKSQAKLRLHDDGTLELLISTVEMGQGSHTALAQIVSDALGIPLSAMKVTGPDTAQTPFDLTTSSSRSITMMGSALIAAADDLKKKLTGIAATTFERPSEELRAENGRVHGVNVAEEMSFADVLKRNNISTLEAFGEHSTNFRLDRETGQGVATPHWHQGAGSAEVEVDTETGKVTVLAFRSSAYSGRTVNPRLGDLQNDGNVIFGLGPTLFEEVLFDEGHVVNQNLSDYQIPSLRDIPPVLESATIEAEGSEYHGLGEMTLPQVSPAVANAIEDAVGVRILELPITPERVLRALKEREGKES